jgi:hypothetical protein
VGVARFMPVPAAMTPDDLRNRTKKFAVDVVKLAKRLPKDSVDRRERSGQGLAMGIGDAIGDL